MIQVVNRALDILEFVAKDAEQVVSLTEIADYLGLNHGTCANITKTLVNRGYIEQIGHKKGYRLGAKAYAITGNAAYKRDLVLAAKEIIEELARKINETTLVAVMHENKRLLLAEAQSNQAIVVRTSTEKLLYETASGRLLIAYLSDAERETFVNKFGLPAPHIWKEANTKEELFANLDKIKKEGFSIIVNSQQIIGLAAPISKHNKVVACLGVFLPEMRYTGKNKKLIIAEMKVAAAKISQKLSS